MRIVDEDNGAAQTGVSAWSGEALAAWRAEGGESAFKDGVASWRRPQDGTGALIGPVVALDSDEASWSRWRWRSTAARRRASPGPPTP
jgi:hypothetical protein